MRAVPEDFDNIQALHSPYGAMHGLGLSLTSPSGMVNQPFGRPLNRPLMVDVRRQEADDSVSPTGLTPVFGNVGFTSSAASSSEIVSPLSATSNDRYPAYSSQLSSFGSGTRSSTAYSRGQGRFDSALQIGQQAIRPLHPLQLRESLSRQRAESMQAPLRTGLSWKGERIDYPGYHQGNNPSSAMADRQPSVYQMGMASHVDSGSYDTESYSGMFGRATSAPETNSLGLQGVPHKHLQGKTTLVFSKFQQRGRV